MTNGATTTEVPVRLDFDTHAIALIQASESTRHVARSARPKRPQGPPDTHR